MAGVRAKACPDVLRQTFPDFGVDCSKKAEFCPEPSDEGMADPEEVRGSKKPVLHRQGAQRTVLAGPKTPKGVTVSIVDRRGLSEQMIGRKILKRLGNTVIFGYVRGYHPGGDGTEESWTLRYENPHSDDPTSQEDEEVRRPELDKRLHLQAVMEREFPKKAAKRGRKRSREHGSPDGKAATESAESSKVKRQPVETSANPTTSSTRGSKAIPANGEKKRRRHRKKRPTDDAEKLRGTEADLGKRIAKEFNEGVFTGEVVAVDTGGGGRGLRCVLWRIDYEDGDGEDLDHLEMKRYMRTYKLLSNRFIAAKGNPVTADELMEEDVGKKDEDGGQHCHHRHHRHHHHRQLDIKTELKSSDGVSKVEKEILPWKLGEPEKLVGTRIRKFFPTYNQEFDGKVAEYYFPESDDEDNHGDLWLIEYEDGDAEHFNADELADAKALYDQRHALVKKQVVFDTKPRERKNKGFKKGMTITLYGEARQPIFFSTMKGYRRQKSKMRSPP